MRVVARSSPGLYIDFGFRQIKLHLFELELFAWNVRFMEWIRLSNGLSMQRTRWRSAYLGLQICHACARQNFKDHSVFQAIRPFSPTFSDDPQIKNSEY